MIDWRLERRRVLRMLGGGAALLPLLPARRSFGADPVFPKRLIVTVMTNGYTDFLPTGSGNNLADLTFPGTASALSDWKKDLVIFPKLTCPNVVGADDFHRAYDIMFTGAPAVDQTLKGPTALWSPTSGTVDQVIAAEIGKRVKLPLRTLALRAPFGTSGSLVDGRTEATRAFWIGQGQPVTPEDSPQKVFDSLFPGSVAKDPAAEKARAEQKSLLDFVGHDLERFGARLGTEDKLAVQGHLQGIRDIETQLAAADQGGAACKSSVTLPKQPFDYKSMDNFPVTLGLQMDLMVAALKCDVTRVATLQFSAGFGTGVVPKWLGIVDNNWHGISHDGGTTRKATIDKFMMGQFAALLKRLASVPEVGPNSKTMLDNTVVLFGNTMWDGNHGPRLPWMLGGSCGGYFKTGQYLRSAAELPVNCVLTEICNAMDVPRTYFGDKSLGGSVPGLKA